MPGDQTFSTPGPTNSRFPTTGDASVPYEPRPLIGARKGRKNLFIPQVEQQASHSELARLLRNARAAQVEALASTARLLGRPTGKPLELTGALIDKLPLRVLEPTRRPAAYPGQLNYTSKVAWRDQFGPYAVWADSFNERNHLKEYAWEHVSELVTQALRIEWTLPSGNCVYHYPDFLLRDARGTVLCDIYAEKFMTPHRASQYDLTRATAEALGWRFEVGSDNLSANRLMNVRLLYGFRHELDGEPVREWGDPVWPATMWGLVQSEGGGNRGWARAFGRLWRREIGFNPEQPLLDTTPLTTTLPASVRRAWMAR